MSRKGKPEYKTLRLDMASRHDQKVLTKHLDDRWEIVSEAKWGLLGAGKAITLKREQLEPVTVPAAPTAPPAGWYPDQADSRVVRWWDGVQWTPHTQPRQ